MTAGAVWEWQATDQVRATRGVLIMYRYFSHISMQSEYYVKERAIYCNICNLMLRLQIYN